MGYGLCGAIGMRTWFHNCNKAALAETLKLRPEQYVMYAQTAGHTA
jgi:hypothetical protein